MNRIHELRVWYVTWISPVVLGGGEQDHVVRVWTRAPERAAPAEVAEGFSKGVVEGRTKAKQVRWRVSLVKRSTAGSSVLCVRYPTQL